MKDNNLQPGDAEVFLARNALAGFGAAVLDTDGPGVLFRFKAEPPYADYANVRDESAGINPRIVEILEGYNMFPEWIEDDVVGVYEIGGYM